MQTFVASLQQTQTVKINSTLLISRESNLKNNVGLRVHLKGDSGVGKTAYAQYLKTKRLLDEHVPTEAFALNYRVLQLNSKKIRVEIVSMTVKKLIHSSLIMQVKEPKHCTRVHLERIYTKVIVE